jgi:hypothetical protein
MSLMKVYLRLLLFALYVTDEDLSYIWMGFNLVGIGLLGILSALSPGRRYRVDAFLLRFNLNEIRWQSALYESLIIIPNKRSVLYYVQSTDEGLLKIITVRVACH